MIEKYVYVAIGVAGLFLPRLNLVNIANIPR